MLVRNAGIHGLKYPGHTSLRSWRDSCAGVFSWRLPPREASGEAARDFSELKQYSTPTLIPPATQASATPTVTILVREIYNHVKGKRQISDSYIKFRNEPIKTVQNNCYG